MRDRYRQRVMDEQGVVRAVVTTSTPIAADKATAIQQSLARATGHTVELSTHVDPEIIGGLVAKVGGTVFDASVVTERLRLRAYRQDDLEDLAAMFGDPEHMTWYPAPFTREQVQIDFGKGWVTKAELTYPSRAKGRLPLVIFLQAYVFALLTAVYIELALHADEH